MKYALTHCYTDHNKGDAAIIVATTQLLRNLDSDAEIAMFSTFGPNDVQFKKEHDFIEKFGDHLYPGLFYQPRPVFKNSDSSRFIHFLWILIKFFVLLVTKNRFILKLFFTKKELEGIKYLLSSDMLISKGGSYLTSQNSSLRQSISLLSMLYPFIFAKRYKKKIVIFSQSLGPVVGSFNRKLTSFSLSNVTKIFFRERLCVEQYPEISGIAEKVPHSFIPDTAFFLQEEGEISNAPKIVQKSKLNVGLTLVDHAFKYIDDENQKQEKINTYKTSILSLIGLLVDQYNANIHIFPQVISNNSHLGHSDVRMSVEIEQKAKENGYGSNVHYYQGDFTPMELKEAYSQMDIFVGTRLHSVIFALSLNVPAINIAYHGTKSQGILASIKPFQDFVLSIDTISPSELNTTVEKLILNKDELSETLKSENKILKLNLLESMKEVIDEAQKV